ncbi:hypothetical protein ILUMI_11986 [Ignelater luminosus]|uniref:Peptidase S1 domain-containing protein n=1 Tax=Ignelater luminosus TaxID=2038154 RepID=A0A8K0CV07_IGNLU|nr:hypothetical protein ILUMI_11986 [Ignelater luminosus]
MTGIAILMVLIIPLVICTNDVSVVDIRIAGGQKANPGQFPFYAQILVMGRDALVCGGSLIHQRWILTVGHCFPSSRRQTQQMAVNNHILVYMGTIKQYNHIGSGTVWQSYAEGVYQHPAFVVRYIDQSRGITDKLSNDMALVHSRQHFPLGPYVQIIKLPNAKIHPHICGRGTIIGSGNTENGSRGDVLYAEVELKWLHNLGVTLPSWTVRSSVFYTENRWNRGHALRGDSGGPYVCYFAKTPVLYGVISSNRNYKDTVITEYESVLNFMDFIKNSVPDVQIHRQRKIKGFRESKENRSRKRKAVTSTSSVRSNIVISFRFLFVILSRIIKIS